jgi:hypothetical protein
VDDLEAFYARRRQRDAELRPLPPVVTPYAGAVRIERDPRRDHKVLRAPRPEARSFTGDCTRWSCVLLRAPRKFWDALRHSDLLSS